MIPARILYPQQLLVSSEYVLLISAKPLRAAEHEDEEVYLWIPLLDLKHGV